MEWKMPHWSWWLYKRRLYIFGPRVLVAAVLEYLTRSLRMAAPMKPGTRHLPLTFAKFVVLTRVPIIFSLPCRQGNMAWQALHAALSVRDLLAVLWLSSGEDFVLRKKTELDFVHSFSCVLIRQFWQGTWGSFRIVWWCEGPGGLFIVLSIACRLNGDPQPRIWEKRLSWGHIIWSCVGFYVSLLFNPGNWRIQRRKRSQSPQLWKVRLFGVGISESLACLPLLDGTGFFKFSALGPKRSCKFKVTCILWHSVIALIFCACSCFHGRFIKYEIPNY